MSSWLNPIFFGKIAKSYLFDINRIWASNEDEIRKYQDKSLRQVLKYAYTVPVYHKKYKKYGIHPNDIKGVADIEKLPVITKSDLMEHFPNDIIPKGFDIENGFLTSTSGSTGKPVFLYCDLFSAVRSLEGFIVELRAYGGNWKKSRIVLIIDLGPGTIEHTVFVKSVVPFLKKFVSLKNIKYLHIDQEPELLIREINEFKPDFLSSDPGMLRKLAFLKKSGYGKDIKPRCIISSAAILDSYTKKCVENAFDVRVLDVYSATETGPIAFECLNGDYYHVHSDFVFLEFLDNENKSVPSGKAGHVIVTKLYGGGTPIIRYSGLDDLVIPIENKCNCGLRTQLISRIEGRSFDSIVVPDGKMFTPLSLTTIIRELMDNFKTYKIKQFQIIQHKLDEIEILIVIHDKLRNVGLPVKRLFEEIKKQFSEKIGSDVKVFVNEVDKIQDGGRPEDTKVVVSKVKGY